MKTTIKFIQSGVMALMTAAGIALTLSPIVSNANTPDAAKVATPTKSITAIDRYIKP